MFADLTAKEIQPQKMDVRHIPEIRISDTLRREIKNVLEGEEGSYARVFECTSVVQTDKNYVFFSNQWFYLAVLCKQYAEALKPYGDFFDEHIRGHQERIKFFSNPNKDSTEFRQLLHDDTDRERLIKYVMGDPSFRPGKALINDGNKVRSTQDIFGSCVLKKLNVPDASSGYLGDLIYYLSSRPQLYSAIEQEVMQQMGNSENTVKLPSVVKDCAKAIVDYIYNIDGFERLGERITEMEQSIKIDTSHTEGLLPGGNWLRYMFALPSSIMYDSAGADGKTRVFDKEYSIWKENRELKCKLTTEWVGTDLTEGGQGNNLQALIKIVNNYYADVLEIRKEDGEYYLYVQKTEFSIDDLPDVFNAAFSKRYITSLLAKPFVILTGNSGTGKTRISKQFAEYLEVIDTNGNKNWLIVPVGADWTDNTKVLGFYNPIAENGAGKYEKTGILKLLERANENPEIPYFLILDEMNLSHVERYFADFLSHMETPDNPFELDGYWNNTDEAESTGRLPYPDNLFVIGTVNVDETTYMFSPKVLDRANVIEFKPEKESVIDMFVSGGKQAEITQANSGVAQAFLQLAKEVRSSENHLDAEQIAKTKEVFTLIYDIAEKNGYEFAYRTVKEIKQYLNASLILSGHWDEHDLYRAIDEQVLQKVLPKIHGNRKEIGNMLEELEIVCSREGKELNLSRKKIEQMKGKLAAVQYASYI